MYWQSLANLCRCRVATWPLSTLNPIWQTSWCVVESFYKMLVYIVTHLCTDRAIKRKESSTPELFQICVNGCNQNGCFHRRDYGTPLRNFIRGKFAKSAKQSTGKPAGQADSSTSPSPACEPSRPEESVRGEQRCPNSTLRVDLPMSEQCRLTEPLFQSCLHANEGVKVQESRGESNLPSLRCRLRHQRSHRAV